MARATQHPSTILALGNHFNLPNSRVQGAGRVALLLLGASLTGGFVSCKHEGKASGEVTRAGDATSKGVREQEPQGRPWVDLTGEFRRVVKPVRGRADVVFREGKYLLYLSGVSVEADGALRVFLVGHENAATTRILTESKLVYDMAALDNGAAEQIIELPSRPDERLRSVVLWQQAFAVNLAMAPLQPSPSP